MKTLKALTIALFATFLSIGSANAYTGAACYTYSSNNDPQFGCPSLNITNKTVKQIYDMGYRVVSSYQKDNRTIIIIERP